jgi:hypothetical protein
MKKVAGRAGAAKPVKGRAKRETSNGAAPSPGPAKRPPVNAMVAWARESLLEPVVAFLKDERANIREGRRSDERVRHVVMAALGAPVRLNVTAKMRMAVRFAGACLPAVRDAENRDGAIVVFCAELARVTEEPLFEIDEISDDRVREVFRAGTAQRCVAVLMAATQAFDTHVRLTRPKGPRVEDLPDEEREARRTQLRDASFAAFARAIENGDVHTMKTAWDETVERAEDRLDKAMRSTRRRERSAPRGSI